MPPPLGDGFNWRSYVFSIYQHQYRTLDARYVLKPHYLAAPPYTISKPGGSPRPPTSHTLFFKAVLIQLGFLPVQSSYELYASACLSEMSTGCSQRQYLSTVPDAVLREILYGRAHSNSSFPPGLTVIAMAR